MKIIGIAGTDGSGKDTVAEMLAEQYGWMAVSVSDFLREEAKKRGLPLKREVLRTISSEWRKQYGLGVLIDKAVEEYKKSATKYTGLAVTPMRNPGEAQRLKDLGGIIVWVDADPEIRYHRILGRNRGTEDHVTLEGFIAEEQAQMHYSGDETTLSLSGVKAKADIFISNDGNDLAEFEKIARKALGLN